MNILGSILILIIVMSESLADSVFNDNFQNSEKWSFLTDQVMGGVSSGNVEFISIENNIVAHVTGKVSTENRGGFIQIRRKLDKINLENSKFIDITAKGNNQKYFIHLRTTGTILPWQYYQIDFNVKNEFQVFRLPIDTFKRSSSFLSNKINPKKIFLRCLKIQIYFLTKKKEILKRYGACKVGVQIQNKLTAWRQSNN